MMKQTSTIVKLFVVLLVVVGLIVLRDYWPFGNSDEKKYQQALNGLTTDAVTQVTVATESASLEMIKANGNWTVNGYVADKNKLDDLVTHVLDAQAPEVVSETKATQDQLGFGGATSKLTLAGNNTQATLELGDTSGSMRYVRFDGTEVVYLVSDLSGLINSTKLSDWIDTNMTAIDQKDIQAIAITKDGNTLTLKQKDGDWFEDDQTQALDPAPLNAMLATVTSVSTQGLADNQDQQLGQPETTVVVTTGSGTTTLSFYVTKSGDYESTSSDRKGIFTVSKAVVDNFAIKTTDLKPKPTPAVSVTPSQ